MKFKKLSEFICGTKRGNIRITIPEDDHLWPVVYNAYPGCSVGIDDYECVSRGVRPL
jgi:hypothetical protein